MADASTSKCTGRNSASSTPDSRCTANAHHAAWLRCAARLDGFLRWTDQPLVKLAEAVLILLLAAQLTGGLRLLFLEFVGWRDGQKTLVALASGLAFAAALLFLVNAV